MIKHWEFKRRQEVRSRRDVAPPLEERDQFSLFPLHHLFFILYCKTSIMPHSDSYHCIMSCNILWKILIIKLIFLDKLPFPFWNSLFFILFKYEAKDDCSPLALFLAPIRVSGHEILHDSHNDSHRFTFRWNLILFYNELQDNFVLL